MNDILKEGEEIKPIKGFPNYYVSNLGNFFTTYPSKRYGKSFRVLREREHPSGYKYIGIYRMDEDGIVRRYWKRSHRVVAQAYIGDVPRSMVVDHINHIKDCNTVENLQIITHKQNIIRYHRHKIKKDGN
jgi:hypothetical protein